jgi:hypothetical protein
MTSDDNWYEQNAIEKMFNLLTKDQNIDFIYYDYWRVGKNDRIISRFNSRPAEELVNSNCVGHCFLYRRKVYERVGDYDTQFFMAEDYEYWLRISRYFKMVNISEPLYYYRIHEKSLTDSEGGFEAIQNSAERARVKWIGPDPYWFPSREKRSLSDLYLFRSFEAHREEMWCERRRFLWKAVLNNPRQLLNRGVRSLFVRSFFRFLTNTEDI